MSSTGISLGLIGLPDNLEAASIECYGPAFIPDAGFSPARALLVSSGGWGDTFNPEVCFDTISAALLRAAAMSPTDTDPVTIVLYPGVYNETLQLVSNVTLASVGHIGAIIGGAGVSRQPGVGINAPQLHNTENVAMTNVTFVDVPVSVTTTTKTDMAKQCSFVTMGCFFIDLATFLPTLRSPDLSIHFDTFFGNVTTNGGTVVSNASLVTGALSVSPSTAGQFWGFASTVFNPSTVGDGALVLSLGSSWLGDLALSGASTLTATNSFFGGDLSVGVLATADIHNSSHNTLSGGGQIQRLINEFTTGVTVAGDNIIPLTPAYKDAAYTVQLTQTSGVPTVPLVTAKSTTDFTLSDATGGNTYAVLVVDHAASVVVPPLGFTYP